MVLSLCLISGAIILSSCGTTEVGRERTAFAEAPGKPYKRGSYAARQRALRVEERAQQRAQQKATHAMINSKLLAQSTKSNTRFIVDIGAQRGYLLVNGKIAVDTPVSTGRPGKSTPRGTYSMTQRVRSGKISTIYKVEMPYWMRLGGSVYGVHAGYLPGYPASAGCIRLPFNAAEAVFNHTTSGTKVTIYNNWDGARQASR